jgi:hypothetical protein
MERTFFITRPDGTRTMTAGEAEEMWGDCRTKAEKHMGREALDRRVYRLRFDHGEPKGELSAEVGQLDPYEGSNHIVSITEFSDCYVMCAPEPRFIVDREATREVEYFAKPG